ncbi:MAG: ribose-phosphate pyrophosphokinase [Spirochaetota bacterium]|nr:MAG: ribose-phosphate pyrophosphokinase [Spirochaetota bacterium]
MTRPELKIISGTSNRELAENIVRVLQTRLTDLEICRFADRETFVQINESVRGADVFVIQSTCNPGNENLMELLIILDTLARASAGRITAVIPYYGYGRQDRKAQPRTPVTAKLVANLITTAGANRILMLDVHALQIPGYFDIPVDHLFATPVLFNYFKESKDEYVIVSPDAGGVERARFFAKLLNANMAIIDKRRSEKNKATVMNIIGEDQIKGANLIIVDDMIDTAGTLCSSAEVLAKRGAKSIYACATHGVFSTSAIDRINKSVLDKVVVTDSIYIDNKGKDYKKIEVLSIAELIAEAIERIHEDRSVASLFLDAGEEQVVAIE